MSFIIPFLINGSRMLKNERDGVPATSQMGRPLISRRCLNWLWSLTWDVIRPPGVKTKQRPRW